MLQKLEDADKTLPPKPPKRDIKLSYRGLEISVQVCDLHTEVEMRLGALVKSASSGAAHGVQPLPWEDAIWGPRTSDVKLRDDMLRGPSSARQALLRMVDDAQLLTFSDVSDVMWRKHSHFAQWDHTWSLDCQVSSYVSETYAKVALQQKVCTLLPTAALEVSAIKVKDDLTQLQAQQHYRWMDKSKRTDVDAILELAVKLERGICPSAAQNWSGFLHEALGRFLVVIDFESHLLVLFYLARPKSNVRP